MKALSRGSMLKKYSVRVVHRMPDRVRNQDFTFKAMGVSDAIVQFERFKQGAFTYDDMEVVAVWQVSECRMTSARKGER